MPHSEILGSRVWYFFASFSLLLFFPCLNAQQPRPGSCSKYFKVQLFKTAKNIFLEAGETFVRSSYLDYHLLLWNFQNTSNFSSHFQPKMQVNKIHWLAVDAHVPIEVWGIWFLSVLWKCQQSLWVILAGPGGLHRSMNTLMQEVGCSKL